MLAVVSSRVHSVIVRLRRRVSLAASAAVPAAVGGAVGLNLEDWIHNAVSGPGQAELCLSTAGAAAPDQQQR